MDFKQQLLDFFSYTKRRNKKLSKMIQKKEKYVSMTDDEFLMEYIETVSLYEYKKLIVFFMGIGILIVFFANIWKYLPKIIDMYAKIVFDETLPLEIELGFELIIWFYIIIMISIVFFCYRMIRAYKKIIEKKNFLEEIKRIRR